MSSRMSGSGREAHSDVREALSDVQEWSGGPPGCLEGLVDAQEWSGGPPGCPGVVEKPSWMYERPARMSGSGWEALPNVREWSEGAHG